ncbi:MAG: hypothetical protein U9Q62_07885 [Campylobacterota bacterium]|nr:hypothetical protein [Campylobacterota bacterium]
MKSNHGKHAIVIFLGWLFLAATLWGETDYRWQVTESEATVYQHEAMEVRYSCRFKDQGSLYSIEMQLPSETEDYRLHVLSEHEQIREGIRTNEYRYILFAKQSGSIIFQPTALMRKTTRDSIENTVIGRDNIEDLTFSDTKVNLPPVQIEILPTSSQLSGHFTLDMQLSSTKVNAYEPIHLSVTLEGEGNLDSLKAFEIKIPGVELFSEKPELSYRLGEHGFRGERTQRFAIVAEKSFTLPPFKVHYFDLGETQEKLLVTDSYEIEVIPAVSGESLLDEVDDEASRTWEWSYLYYVLIFITGYIAGRWLRFRRSSEPKDESLAGRIRGSESIKKLITLLVLSGDLRFTLLIEKLERASSVSLNSAKKEALGVLHED